MRLNAKKEGGRSEEREQDVINNDKSINSKTEVLKPYQLECYPSFIVP